MAVAYYIPDSGIFRENKEGQIKERSIVALIVHDLVLFYTHQNISCPKG